MEQNKSPIIYDSQNLYSVEEVAEYLQVSTETVRRYCRTGKIKATKLGNTYRIRRSDVEKLLNA